MYVTGVRLQHGVALLHRDPAHYWVRGTRHHAELSRGYHHHDGPILPRRHHPGHDDRRSFRKALQIQEASRDADVQ